MQNEVKIQVACSECGRQEVRYTAVQLRSADEGSTIFYTCDCGNKYGSTGHPKLPDTKGVQMEHKQLNNHLRNVGYRRLEMLYMAQALWYLAIYE
jgi:hypothetical protein